ncbi:hypothetical protein BYT27DRAFT_7169557 [Phlegmacium glaucopus]|nr:hypothetical protein BYT27DRAFT_7169557 [Phlegmacium glaucopus]
MQNPEGDIPVGSDNLSWINVAIALAFILFDIGVSTVLRLGIGLSLLIAALRCIGQLALVATILQKVFETENPWLVALICFVLNFLGTFETVINKSSRRFNYMFPAVLIAMLGSTIPIAMLGTKFAMSVNPFWTPIHFIPIVGMLCGASVSGIVVANTYILREFQENRDKIEIYLAFGATRIEACRPIAIQALKLALTPPINSMSVIGIIAIPGMMTGAILGGSSVQQAAKLQMIIMFMIAASTVLASVFITFAAISVVVDLEHRIRSDLINDKKPAIYRVKDWDVGELSASLSKSFNWRTNKPPRTRESDLEEHGRLLT